MSQRVLERKTAADLVDNFIRQYRKPFDLDTITNLVGVSKRLIKARMEELLAEGEIRQPEPGIYVANIRPIYNCIEVNGQSWSYKKDVAKALLEELEKQDHSSLRSIAQAMGVSRQYAYMYMLALGSLKMIGWNGKRWYATGRGEISMIGCKIEKGCLAWMKGRGRRDRVE